MNIKSKLLTFVTLLFGFHHLLAQTPVDTLKIDLNEAISIALSESPTIKIDSLEITKLGCAQKESYGGLMPKIDLAAQYQRTIKKQTMYMDKSSMGFGGPMPGDTSGIAMPDDDEPLAIQFGRWNMWTGGVNATLPLVVPSLWKSLDLSEIDLTLAVEKSRANKITLINNVKKSFYSLLFTQETYNVFKKTYYKDSVNYNNIKAKFDQGVASEYDMIIAKVQMQNNIPNILQAKNMMRIAELQLKIFMGTDDDIAIAAVGSLQYYKDNTNTDLTKLIEPNLSNNSDLKQFDIQKQKAQTALEVVKLQRLPSLIGTFGYNYISQNDDFKFRDYKWSPYSTAGITLAIPLFNGFQRHYSIKQTEISLQQLDLQRINLKRSLQLGIKNNIGILENTLEQLETAKSTIDMAEKGYEIALKMYNTGLATIVELNSASLAITNTNLKYQNILFDYLNAQADLEKIIGDNIE
ncbi:MAG: TolC family protein [Bacteroidales bacterium]|jgi:outer membrane protein